MYQKLLKAFGQVINRFVFKRPPWLQCGKYTVRDGTAAEMWREKTLEEVSINRGREGIELKT